MIVYILPFTILKHCFVILRFLVLFLCVIEKTLVYCTFFQGYIRVLGCLIVGSKFKSHVVLILINFYPLNQNFQIIIKCVTPD